MNSLLCEIIIWSTDAEKPVLITTRSNVEVRSINFLQMQSVTFATLQRRLMKATHYMQQRYF